ncbi:MAG: adenylyltransferase/cytidyltransferase family protein [Deltaproteobacteria bacterium]|nr:adenylyltransferase/cytidyltransferase family protein [Deltaproteobacteria bacterium]MBW2396747.1 adenylyltransferase/cytidyltransferase family protein [Deltaproteobacteria bacterium]
MTRKNARSKILTRNNAQAAVRRAQRRGERVVFTSGCFDLLHVGHVRSLEQARSFGDRLVVAINSDASVRRFKGPERPIVPARQRAEVLAALECVDWVMVFGGATPRATLAALSPDVFAKGGDWPLAVLEAQDLPPGFEGEVRRLRQIADARTTAIVERIRRKR